MVKNDWTVLECLEDMIAKSPLLDNKDWLAKRRTGLGGSDTPAIMGLSPWSDQAMVYASKVLDLPPIKTTISMERGNYLEPLVSKLFAEQINMEVISPSAYDTCPENGEIFDKSERIFEHPYYPFILASIDSFLYDHEKKRIGILEIKTACGYGCAKWDEGVPDMYVVQLQKYMMIIQYILEEQYGLDIKIFGYMAYLLDDKFDYTEEIAPDIELWSIIEQADIEFWDKHILKLEAPEPTTLDSAKKLYSQKVSKGYKQIDVDVVLIMKKFKELKDNQKELDAPVNKIKQDIDAMQLYILNEIQLHDKLLYGDNVVATYLPDKHGTKRLSVKYATVSKILNELKQ